MYGLKQASRQWFTKLSTALVSLGYTQSKSDDSFFIKNKYGSFITLLVYIDDVILAENNMAEIDHVKRFLDSSFQIKDLSALKFFLEMEIAITSKGLSINQRKYALEILEDAGYLASKLITTPMDCSLKLHKMAGTPLSYPSSYRRIIGRLLNLTTTRPDLTYIVQYLSQYLATPTELHMKVVHRILRYIKASLGTGLFFPANSPI